MPIGRRVARVWRRGDAEASRSDSASARRAAPLRTCASRHSSQRRASERVARLEVGGHRALVKSSSSVCEFDLPQQMANLSRTYRRRDRAGRILNATSSWKSHGTAVCNSLRLLPTEPAAARLVPNHAVHVLILILPSVRWLHAQLVVAGWSNMLVLPQVTRLNGGS